MPPFQRPRHKRSAQVAGLIAGLGLVLTAAWASDLLEQAGKALWLEMFPPSPSWVLWIKLGWGVGFLGMAVLCTFALYKLRTAFLVSWARMVPAEKHGCRALIVALSLPGGEPEKTFAAAKQLDQGTGLDELCKAVNGPLKGWSWQQPFRAISSNKATLKRITVIASRETYQHLNNFKEIAARILPPEIEIVISASLLDLNDYNAVQTVLLRTLDEAIVAVGGDERKVCIDITSGIKVFSVAAAVVTLNRRAVFSYIVAEFGKATWEMRYYDASIGGEALT